jgi:hypothetical protein
MLGRLDEAAARLPDPAILVGVTRLREVVNTLPADGAALSLRDLATIDFTRGQMDPDADSMALRQLAAYDDAIRRMAKGEPLGATLQSWSAATIAGLDRSAGAATGTPWRTRDLWFGGPRPSDAYLLALPPGARLRVAGEQVFEWIDSDVEMPIIVKVSATVYQLLTVSPVDNMEFVLSTYVPLELVRAGVLRSQVLPVSVLFDRCRDDLPVCHRAMVDKGDLDEWVIFIANEIIELCKYQMNLIDELQKLHYKFLHLLVRTNDSLGRMATLLASSPYIDYKKIMETCGISARHTRSLVARLREAGMVREGHRAGGRKIFENPDVLRLLGLYEGLREVSDRNALAAPPD